MCFDSLYVPTSILEIWLRLKKTGTEVRHEVDQFTGHYVSGKGFSNRRHRFTRSSYFRFPPSTVIKKSFEKAQKESRDLDSEDVAGRTCKANPSEYDWRRWNVGNTSWFCKEATTSWCSRCYKKTVVSQKWSPVIRKPLLGMSSGVFAVVQSLVIWLLVIILAAQ